MYESYVLFNFKTKIHLALIYISISRSIADGKVYKLNIFIEDVNAYTKVLYTTITRKTF